MTSVTRRLDCFCMGPMTVGPSNYLSCCSCSGHLVDLFLGCTSGLNLATDLGPILALHQRALRIGRSITVWLTSCLTGFDLTKQVKLMLMQHKQSS